jgi:hypothetical protein
MRLTYQIANVFYLYEDVPDRTGEVAYSCVYQSVAGESLSLRLALRLRAEGWTEDEDDLRVF